MTTGHICFLALTACLCKREAYVILISAPQAKSPAPTICTISGFSVKAAAAPAPALPPKKPRSIAVKRSATHGALAAALTTSGIHEVGAAESEAAHRVQNPTRPPTHQVAGTSKDAATAGA